MSRTEVLLLKVAEMLMLPGYASVLFGCSFD
jgi:hypothetical protein